MLSTGRDMQLPKRWLWHRLRPRGYETAGVEQIDRYLRLATRVLPAWPVSAIEQLLYRHFSQAAEVIGDGPRTVTFCETVMSAAEVCHSIRPNDPECVEAIGRYLLEWPSSRRTWLMSYMINRRTWPVPIMVQTDGDYVRLVEGHKRLGYLWALVDSGTVSINSTHTVLIVSRV